MRLNSFSLVKFALVAGAILLTPSAGHSCLVCECEPKPPGTTARDRRDQVAVVFAGTVRTTRGDGDERVTRLTVDSIWKGSDALGRRTEVVVRSAFGETACGVNFRTGVSYLVYAGMAPDTTFRTGLCHGTRELRAAQAHLAELGPGRAVPRAPEPHHPWWKFWYWLR